MAHEAMQSSQPQQPPSPPQDAGQGKQSGFLRRLMPGPGWLAFPAIAAALPLATAIGVVSLSAFLWFLSYQTPDQHTMTLLAPWQHNMNAEELISYHKALKAGAYDHDDSGASDFLRRQTASAQLASQPRSTQPQRVEALQEQRSLSQLEYQQQLGFASSAPINQTSLAQTQAILDGPTSQRVSRWSQTTEFKPDGIYIQTASLSSKAHANQALEQLRNLGFEPFIQQARVNDQNWFRVRLGPFTDRVQAQQIANRLEQASQQAQIINTRRQSG